MRNSSHRQPTHSVPPGIHAEGTFGNRWVIGSIEAAFPPPGRTLCARDTILFGFALAPHPDSRPLEAENLVPRAKIPLSEAISS